MKKVVIAVAMAALFFGQNANAQTGKGLYFGANAGYNLGTNGYNLPAGMLFQVVNQTEISSGVTKTELANIKSGSGLNFGATVGYMFSKNIGTELGINYLLSSKSETKQTRLNGSYQNFEVTSNMIQFKPTLVFTAGYEKINPYVKLGMIVGTGKVEIAGKGLSTSTSTVTETEMKLNGGIPVGFQGALGLTYAVNKNISLFGELDFNNMTYSPKKGSFTKYTRNGVDQLPSMDVNDKEFEFDDSITSGSSSSTQPTKTYKVPFSYDSIGLNVGMRYSL